MLYWCFMFVARRHHHGPHHHHGHPMPRRAHS